MRNGPEQSVIKMSSTFNIFDYIEKKFDGINCRRSMDSIEVHIFLISN